MHKCQRNRLMKAKKQRNSSVEFLVCPHCSSTNFYIDDNGSGKCDYCGATFILKKEPEQQEVQVKIVEREVLYEHSDYALSDEGNTALCKRSLINSFKKYLPLWITTWVFMILSIVAFGFVMSSDTNDNSNVVNVVLSLIATICTTPLWISATVATRVDAKKAFTTIYCNAPNRSKGKKRKNRASAERTMQSRLNSAKIAWKESIRALSPSQNSPRVLLYILYVLASSIHLIFNALSCGLSLA